MTVFQPSTSQKERKAADQGQPLVDADCSGCQLDGVLRYIKDQWYVYSG